MFSTTLSFPSISEVVCQSNHPQADSVLKNLKAKHAKENSHEYPKLQKVLTNHAMDMIDNQLKTKSVRVNPESLGIREIVCHKPLGGTRVLRIYPVAEATWTKNFTGDKWRVDTKTIGGAMTDVNVQLNKDEELIAALRTNRSRISVRSLSASLMIRSSLSQFIIPCKL